MLSSDGIHSRQTAFAGPWAWQGAQVTVVGKQRIMGALWKNRGTKTPGKTRQCPVLSSLSKYKVSEGSHNVCP